MAPSMKPRDHHTACGIDVTGLGANAGEGRFLRRHRLVGPVDVFFGSLAGNAQAVSPTR